MKPVVAIAAAVLAVQAVPELRAQLAERYDVRLAPTPRDTAMRATIAGRGRVEAILVDGRLTVSGTFEGLKSPATRAEVRQGPATAVRGPVLAMLDLGPDRTGTAGTIGGVVELEDEALEALAAGRLYIQLDSEAAPDGNLWGWLLPP